MSLATTRRPAGAGLTLARRLRRWSNFKPALIGYLASPRAATCYIYAGFLGILLFYKAGQTK